MSAKSCFIMGLPDAGKTTYLAALWYSLNLQDRTVLSLKEYTGDHKYLAKISETWLDAEKVSRTTIQSEQKILPLLLKDHYNQQFEISFPDLSGESFQKQYSIREIDKDLEKYILYSNGILLFINPNIIKEPWLISEFNYKNRHSDNISDEKIPTRNPISDDPTDVQLVELLQFIHFIKDCNHKKLGIIISAWDVITKYDKPENFVKAQLPFLWQYLYCNSTIFDTFYYGVSAQGGPLETEADSAKLSDFDDPIDRILVIDNDGNKCNDITLPLWETLKENEGETK